MKKCAYCGKEYPDEVAVCAIDQEPLKFDTRSPSEEKLGGGWLWWLKPGAGSQNLGKTKATIMIAASCLLAAAITWMSLNRADGSADEATNRDVMRCWRSLHRFAIAQKVLPAYAADLFHLSQKEAKVAARFELGEKALVRSGYFIEVPITGSNRTAPQTISNIQKAFRQANAHMFSRTESNSIIVICRPDHRYLCAKAAGND